MIRFKQGNLLEADVEALVNTVNCVGVMGKGIALQFKQAFPSNFSAYQRACKAGKVQPGSMLTVQISSVTNPKYVINFPTKRHWKEKSRLADIASGLKTLTAEIQRLGIRSIAIPPLGCGNGGLNWRDVSRLIEQAFAELPEVEVWVYGPSGSPEPDRIRIGTSLPRMTTARALLIAAMELYSTPGYRLSLLEVQKLAYFLQEMGAPLKLNFVAHLYGPYAENLNYVLQRIEGHFIRGYGDRSKEAQIYLLPKAAEQARAVLASDPASLEHLSRVQQIIEGFETPYGMELLATVHWLCHKHPSIRSNPERVVEAVHNWNERKKRLFQPVHIRIALEHLVQVEAFRKN
ncbi:type II toxin-antitoxin system antitoxin DNA ADP-ribosyl glycohydrolase DarG [Alicyclobacillus shizuokensis]|uniref:type II toxin-antitoxin system antitoxin DNA ADP-ribosyl glycohydrolase DarG n=1 Tax=Alicyclobacillus shizuokensis TaxID=392014 RepID=UPI0008329648|nr:macro domain-containing protein [Alicyclobacillus shizuokensis]MCL6625198.1 macro domain-containing protein [Alicyclobacillus shizuokensis]